MKIAKIIIISVAILLLIAPSVMSEVILTGATCYRLDVGAPVYFHGYTCHENTGGWRGFRDPGAYEAMNAYYVPPLEETFIPTRTYVYAGASETYMFSGQ